MVSYPFVGLCIWVVLSTAGLITFAVLFAQVNPDKYLTNCTVAEDTVNHCILVAPINGNITFPYEIGVVPEYLGGRMSCNYINQTLDCYIYDYDDRGDVDQPPHPQTGVTTSRSKAIAQNNVAYIVMIAIFGLSEVIVAVVLFCLSWTMGLEGITKCKGPKCCRRNAYTPV